MIVDKQEKEEYDKNKDDALVVYEYDEFGNVTFETVVDEEYENFDTPYRYAGYEYIEKVGLYDLNARYYNSEIGRFLSVDPSYNLGNRVIGVYEINVPNIRSIMQATVLYVYCSNDPIDFFDCFGYHDLPVIENNQTIDVRFDLRFLLNRYNGVLKYDEETKIISMKAFGVEAEIKSTDYTLVDDHVHVTLGEFLDIFNVEYECEKAVYSVDEKGVMKQKFHEGVESLISSFALDTVSNASKTLKAIGYGVGFLETLFGGNKSGVRTGTYLAQTYTFGTNAVLITSDKGGNSSSNRGFYADFEIKRWDFTMNTSATIDDYENGYKMPYKKYDDLIND